MSTLLIPAAGLSTRFGLNRPKFLLQHPLGRTMLEESVAGLLRGQDGSVSSILIVSTQENFRGIDYRRLEERIRSNWQVDTKIVLLKKQTVSMVETVVRGIETLEKDVPLIIRDTDSHVLLPENSEFLSSAAAIAYIDLRNHLGVAAGNKSFVELEQSEVVGILEKQISSNFSYVGLAKFPLASSFYSAAASVRGTGETFVSDVVRNLIEDGVAFRGVEASEYSDWGTLEDWLKFTSEFQTLFVDVDGVVSKNMSPIAVDNNWSKFEPIYENCQRLLELERLGKTRIIFCTSRSEEFRSSLEHQLIEFGFNSPTLVMGLPHARRVVINDYAITNPYPSASAISIERNSPQLPSLI